MTPEELKKQLNDLLEDRSDLPTVYQKQLIPLMEEGYKRYTEAVTVEDRTKAAIHLMIACVGTVTFGMEKSIPLIEHAKTTLPKLFPESGCDTKGQETFKFLFEFMQTIYDTIGQGIQQYIDLR